MGSNGQQRRGGRPRAPFLVPGREAENPPPGGVSWGAPGRIRTCGLSLRRRTLYPLSYGRVSLTAYRRTGTLAASHGPLALLRRDRRIGAPRPGRTAGAAGPPRRRQAALRLRRGDPAPAAAHGRAARDRRGVPHALPSRPLARAARDAEVVRPARPAVAGGPLRASGHARGDGDRRAHDRPPRLRAGGLRDGGRRP